MKLDEGFSPGKLTLDFTPLIDIVFLLVLFFAVSTSFINPEDLEKLKDQVARQAAHLLQLDQTVQSTRNELSETRGALSRTRSELSESRDLVEQQRDMIQIQDERNREAGRALDRAREDLAARKRDIQTVSQQLQREQGAVAELNRRRAAQQQQLLAANDAMAALQRDLAAERLAGQEKNLQHQQQMAQLRIRITERAEAHRQSVQQSRQRLLAESQRVERLQRDLEARNRETAERTRAFEQSLAERDRWVQEQLQRAEGLEKQLLEHRQNSERQLTTLRAAMVEKEEELEEKSRWVQEQLQRADELEEQVDELQKANADFQALAHLDRKQIERLARAHKNINAGLETFLEENKVGIRRKQDRIVLELSDKILFDPGRADIKRAGLPVLRRVGQILKERAKGMRILVGGHTDNVPSRGSGYRSNNWSLSAARAVEVVRLLETDVGIDPRQLAAVGFGEYQPVAPNSSRDGRALNRRIEIILLSE